jgi:hypothetical protein
MSFSTFKIPNSEKNPAIIDKDSSKLDSHAQEPLQEYLTNNVEEYRRLRYLRQKVHSLSPQIKYHENWLISSSTGLGE